MSACYLFIGPTISPAEVCQVYPEAVCLPPVQQGDIYRLVVNHKPHIIAIVDGYFQQRPAVWHKEILWAMARGCHVYGSSSMGALRAVELAAFGMRGVGKIFTAYQNGRWPSYENEPFSDDDEVAVIHGPAQTGYIAISEALVNIRATLALAAELALISPLSRDVLVGVAKRLYYPRRRYERVLAEARQQALIADDELQALQNWLPEGRINQKREDALSLLSTLAATPEQALQTDYHFETTTLWERMVKTIAASDDNGAAENQRILRRLKADPRRYREVKTAAWLRLLTLAECERQATGTDQEQLARVLDAWRQRFRLYRRADIDRWLRTNAMTAGQLERLLEEQAKISQITAFDSELLDRYMIDQLRLDGDYPDFAPPPSDEGP